MSSASSSQRNAAPRAGWLRSLARLVRPPSRQDMVGGAAPTRIGIEGLPDGVGLLYAARRLGRRLPERVPGSELIYHLAERAAARGWPLFLLGAAPGVAEEAGELLRQRYPGLVVAESEVRVMTWGFPLVLKGKSGKPLKPKPVNNAREDKLGTAFWRASFERRRCLIPATAWAEAEGAKGAMTRTWYSLGSVPAECEMTP